MSLRRRAPTSLRTESLSLGGATFEHPDALSPHSVGPLSASRGGNKGTADYSKLCLGLGFLLVLAPWLYQSTVQWRLSGLTSDVTDLQQGRRKLLSDLRRASESLRKMKEESKSIEAENAGFVADLSAHGDNIDVESNVYSESEVLEESYVQRITQLEAAIQKKSARTVLTKYGQGPFYIKVELKNDGGAEDTANAFVIETYNLKSMPHAIDHFLQTVEQQLWDGLTMIYRNVNSHAIHTSTLVSETGELDEERFVTANLTSLAFAEHSPDFPMEMYSVAFQGLPGGPGFYINMDSNLANRQDEDTHHACFGKVVEGKGVLDNLFKQNRKTNNLLMLGIESVTILPVPKRLED